MRKGSIRNGIDVPFTLSRDEMFILHESEGSGVIGVYCGNKADEPVCIQNHRVVVKDSLEPYQAAPHDLLIIVSLQGDVYLPKPEQICDGHRVVVHSLPAEFFVLPFKKVHHKTDEGWWMVPDKKIELMYSSQQKKWIPL